MYVKPCCQILSSENGLTNIRVSVDLLNFSFLFSKDCGCGV